MKRLTLMATILCSIPLPLLAQTQMTPVVVGGPVELHNPHRVSSLGGALSDTVPQVMVTPGPPSNATVAMCAAGKYLFVLQGDSLFQFDKKTLKLLKSVQLPHLPLLAQQTDGGSEIKSFTSAPFKAAPTSLPKP